MRVCVRVRMRTCKCTGKCMHYVSYIYMCVCVSIWKTLQLVTQMGAGCTGWSAESCAAGEPFPSCATENPWQRKLIWSSWLRKKDRVGWMHSLYFCLTSHYMPLLAIVALCCILFFSAWISRGYCGWSFTHWHFMIFRASSMASSWPVQPEEKKSRSLEAGNWSIMKHLELRNAAKGGWIPAHPRLVAAISCIDSNSLDIADHFRDLCFYSWCLAVLGTRQIWKLRTSRGMKFDPVAVSMSSISAGSTWPNSYVLWCLTVYMLSQSDLAKVVIKGCIPMHTTCAYGTCKPLFVTRATWRTCDLFSALASNLEWLVICFLHWLPTMNRFWAVGDQESFLPCAPRQGISADLCLGMDFQAIGRPYVCLRVHWPHCWSASSPVASIAFAVAVDTVLVRKSWSCWSCFCAPRLWPFLHLSCYSFCSELGTFSREASWQRYQQMIADMQQIWSWNIWSNMSNPAGMVAVPNHNCDAQLLEWAFGMAKVQHFTTVFTCIKRLAATTLMTRGHPPRHSSQ